MKLLKKQYSVYCRADLIFRAGNSDTETNPRIRNFYESPLFGTRLILTNNEVMQKNAQYWLWQMPASKTWKRCFACSRLCISHTMQPLAQNSFNLLIL